MTLHFRARIEILGVNPYVPVSAEQAAQLQAGWRKPLPVLVQVNGEPQPPWPINLMPTGDGSFYCYLHADVRRASATGVGDTVNVALCFDPHYRPGPSELPPALQAALADHPQAQRNWDRLPPSRQKEVVRYLARLKSPEALARNLARALDALSGRPTHFLGRDWRDGQ